MNSNPGAAAGGFLKDFGNFIMQGNVLDLAVAVIIGGAFGKIITSLIDDVLTPLILKPALTAAKVDDIAELTAGGIKYGSFLSSVINFLVIAFVIFLVVKAFEKAKRKMFRRDAMAAAEQTDPVVATENLTASINALNQTMQSRGM
jgi:large conductance mechanosensitive channel